MIVIIAYDKDHNQVDYIDGWELGSPPFRHVLGLRGSSLHVIANGPELKWILENIQGIRKAPNANSRHNMRWTGEDAVFIANHLPHPDDLKG